MKVLMVHDQSAIIGGAEVQVQREIEGLRDRGHDVCLVAGGCGQGTATSLAPDYSFRTDGSFVRRNLRMVHNPGAAKVLRQAMSVFQPDVVHCHTFTMAGPATLRNAAPAACVATLHDYSVMYPRLGVTFSESQICGIGDFACCRRHVGVRYPFELARTTWAQRTLRRCDAIIAPSRAVAEAASAQGLERIAVVNGSVGGSAPPPPRSGASSVAIYVGRLEPEKGVETLLSEFALLLQEVPSARLHVLGDGSLRASIARAAAEIGESVVLRGSVSPDQAMSAICDAAFAVVPSLWPEPFGLIGPEAFACGVPVVGSGRGGMADWLKHEANGLIADPARPGALASAMKRLLTDPKVMQRCREGARRSAPQYSGAAHAKALEAVYEEALRHRWGPGRVAEAR